MCSEHTNTHTHTFIITPFHYIISLSEKNARIVRFTFCRRQYCGGKCVRCCSVLSVHRPNDVDDNKKLYFFLKKLSLLILNGFRGFDGFNYSAVIRLDTRKLHSNGLKMEWKTKWKSRLRARAVKIPQMRVSNAKNVAECAADKMRLNRGWSSRDNICAFHEAIRQIWTISVIYD